MTVGIGQPFVNAAQQGAGGAAGVVQLSGDTNNAFNFGDDANAHHRVTNDGTFSERDNFSISYDPVNPLTDWVIPNSAAPGSYRVRHTSESGDTGGSFWFPAGAINTYIALTLSREYRVRDNTSGFGGKSVTYTLEIDDGSVSQDTGSYTLTADREDF